jgi:hypothetical protein
LAAAALLPKPLGFNQGIDLGLLPPGLLVTSVVERSVMRVAQRHDPLIAGFGAQRARLSEADVVGMAGRPAADQAGQGGVAPCAENQGAAPRGSP